MTDNNELQDLGSEAGVNKNPTCKVKPRVTAQSKGQSAVYKAVFTNVDEANALSKTANTSLTCRNNS